ncbi:uncharacterized protein C8Q71DRAFT_860376 [Rhodofomes roseus]|uniref:Uncharacterized protein n=1 Tax=Rhodofomes roseus TaxID=34475 RepID=A0ABQ8K8R8_9APHY|nr:uncharacterized protein C8Q71DRAFT_860376 [Rhodofomes roseus]KAH9833594.1 hypothetical protein C8Q71DRAFT_860376 [Rhodofomes roseus]
MSSSTSTGWVTVAIALPIIVFVALLILVLVLIRRRVQKRTQQLEDGAIWERGPLIMVSQTTVVHKDARWSLPRKPTLRVPFLSRNDRPQPERPVTDVAISRSQNSDESYISIRFERSETDNNPGLRSDKPDTSDPNCQSPQSPDSRSKEASDEYMSSVGHDAASAIPHLAVRIPQWPAWLPRWPSPVPSRKASSSQGHSASTRSHEPFPDLKLQPPRIVRLEPSFLHEYRPLNRHAHNESTASLIPSAAPPGTSEPPTPVLTPPPAASPPHVRHGSISRPNTPPSRTPSVPSSLLAGGRRPSAATSVSSSAVARFPQFDGDRADAQTPSGSVSRTSTAASEFAEVGRLPNPFTSSASPWRGVLAAVGEVGNESAEGHSVASAGADPGRSALVTPGSPLPRVRSQHAFHAMPLYYDQLPEERPTSTMALPHGRSPSSATSAATLSSKPSNGGSAMLSPHPSYSTAEFARRART